MFLSSENGGNAIVETNTILNHVGKFGSKSVSWLLRSSTPHQGLIFSGAPNRISTLQPNPCMSKLFDVIFLFLFFFFPLWLLSQLKPQISVALCQLSPCWVSSSICRTSPHLCLHLAIAKTKLTPLYSVYFQHLFPFLKSFLGWGAWPVTLSQEVFEICLQHAIEKNETLLGSTWSLKAAHAVEIDALCVVWHSPKFWQF